MKGDIVVDQGVQTDHAVLADPDPEKEKDHTVEKETEEADPETGNMQGGLALLLEKGGKYIQLF